MIQVKLEFDSNVAKEVDTNWINIISTYIFNDNNINLPHFSCHHLLSSLPFSR